MRWARLICIGVAGLALLASPALPDQRHDWFDKAVQLDLSGSDDAAHAAYSLFRRAAEAGLPEAEFNVAVMLDSGRGVASDIAAAATWYARAAARGNRRAAYNLGQLYEAGQGVPRNSDVARAWFALSGLPAAQERITQLAGRANYPVALSGPVPVAPRPAERLRPSDGGIELVWIAPAEPESVSFTLEIRRLDLTSSQEVFADRRDTTSLLATLPDQPGDYAWRVLAIAGKAGKYAPSAWTVFHIVSLSAAREAADPLTAPSTR